MKNPLFDSQFLYDLDHYRNRKIYVRIISLTSEEYPIEQIEGVATGGTITIDGSSAVRRVCNLTMTTQNVNINNIYWGLTTRIKIEIGLEKDFDIQLNSFTEQYQNYPSIVWFPQGIYILTDFKANAKVNGYTINLSAKDKMCLLNGDIGGVFNASTDVIKEEYWDEELGKFKVEKKPLDYLIRELVHHYGKENFGHIVVEIETAREILENRSGITLYVIEPVINGQANIEIRTAENTDLEFCKKGSYTPIDFTKIEEDEDFVFKYSIDEDDSTLTDLRLAPTVVINKNNYLKLKEDKQRFIDFLELLEEVKLRLTTLYKEKQFIGEDLQRAIERLNEWYLNQLNIKKQKFTNQLENIIYKKSLFAQRQRLIEYLNDPNSIYTENQRQELEIQIQNIENEIQSIPEVEEILTKEGLTEEEKQEIINNLIDQQYEIQEHNISNEINFLSQYEKNILELLDKDYYEIQDSIINIDEEINNLIEYTIKKVEDKEDIGYRLKEIEYPEEEFIVAAGDTVTSVFDKIIQYFPTYEYYYDLDGKFIFKSKDTYVNTSWNNEVRLGLESYVYPYSVSSKVVYAFDGDQLVTSFQNNPKLNSIKNDYTVWGKKKTLEGSDLPIHMRYAIDEKPKYYVKFQSQQQIEDGEMPILYVTQDFADELDIKAINSIKNTWIERKTKPPQYLYDAIYYSYQDWINEKKLTPIRYSPAEINQKWWDILEWAEYYKEIFGEYPQEQLMNYGTVGFIGDFKFPNGDKIEVNPNSSYYCMNKVFTSIGNMSGAQGPLLIFDTYKDDDNPYFGQLVTRNGKTNGSWNPFQHGFFGCGHTYKQFFDRNSEGTVRSWIFCPVIPKDAYQDLTKDLQDIEKFYNIQIVDWREIIYQMALDYYAYGHDDDFNIKLFENNNLILFEIPKVYDYSGLTGYEQYYHDIQGFWRMLYIPNKEEYFSQFRKVSGTKKNTLIESVIWSEDNNVFTILDDENIDIDIDTGNEEEEDEIDSFIECYVANDGSGTLKNVKDDEALIINNKIITLDILRTRALAIEAYEKENLDPIKERISVFKDQIQQLQDERAAIRLEQREALTEKSRHVNALTYCTTYVEETEKFMKLGLLNDINPYIINEDIFFNVYEQLSDSLGKSAKEIQQINNFSYSIPTIYFPVGNIETNDEIWTNLNQDIQVKNSDLTEEIEKKTSEIYLNYKYGYISESQYNQMLENLSNYYDEQQNKLESISNLSLDFRNSNTQLTKYASLQYGSDFKLVKELKEVFQGKVYSSFYLQLNNFTYNKEKQILYYNNLYPCTFGLPPYQELRARLLIYFSECAGTNLSQEEKQVKFQEIKTWYDSRVYVQDENVTIEQVFINNKNLYDNIIKAIINLENFDDNKKYMKEAYTYHTYYDRILDFQPEYKLLFTYVKNIYNEQSGETESQEISCYAGKENGLSYDLNEKIEEFAQIADEKQPLIDGLSTNIINLQMDLIPVEAEAEAEKQKIQQAADNISYPYSLFYNCEKNEEDFYHEIQYTKYGMYPIYIPYTTNESMQFGFYNKDIILHPENLIFWFDFWDATSIGLGQYSTKAIGVRPKVVNNDAIKALIYQDVPDCIFINQEDYEENPTNPALDGYDLIIMDEDNEYRKMINEGLIVGSTRSATAQEEIDNLLYTNGYCNAEVNLTTVPIYYLKPNIIISAKDELQLVNGYYILTRMSIPLNYNGTMQSTCIRVPERTY